MPFGVHVYDEYVGKRKDKAYIHMDVSMDVDVDFGLCLSLQSVETNVVANINSVNCVRYFSSWKLSSISAFMCRMIYCGYSVKIQTFLYVNAMPTYSSTCLCT